MEYKIIEFEPKEVPDEFWEGYFEFTETNHMEMNPDVLEGWFPCKLIGSQERIVKPCSHDFLSLRSQGAWKSLFKELAPAITQYI